MSKKSVTARNKKRSKISSNVDRVKNRKNLKKALVSEDGVEAMFALQSRPRNESKTRVVKRCKCCGRPKGVYRKFAMCRLCLIKYAGLGMIAGLTMASW